jgi:hypothetical protein
MRQVMLLNSQDLENLAVGMPILINALAPGMVEVRYETPRHRIPIQLSDGQPAEPPRHACPFCEGEFASMGTHIRQKHPDKGLVATGGVKCRWCQRRYPTKRSSFRHEVRMHKAKWKETTA